MRGVKADVDDYLPDETWSLSVKKTVACVARMAQEFCGDAHLSLEGDDLPRFQIRITREPQPRANRILKRNTTWPSTELLILPLDDDTVDEITRCILPRIGLRRRVHHVLLEKAGTLVFASYDWFHEGMAWVTKDIRTGVLDDLVEQGVLKSYIDANR